MGRPRKYLTDAARQAAYRKRQTQAEQERMTEWEAIIDAAWELRDVLQAAAARGHSDAAQLSGLKPSEILLRLSDRYRT